MWVQETYQFKEGFQNICNEDDIIGHFIKAEVEDAEKFHIVKNDFLFFCERMEI